MDGIQCELSWSAAYRHTLLLAEAATDRQAHRQGTHYLPFSDTLWHHLQLREEEPLRNMPLGNLIHNCEQTQQLSDRDMKPAIKKTNCLEKHRSKPKKRNTTFFGGFRWTFSQISCSSLYNGTVDGSNPTLLDKKTGLRFFILRFHWSAFFCKYTNDKKNCLVW